MKEFQGRVAVVTGGASGIGLGMCRAFAAEGMKVVVADIETEARDAAVASLRESGAEAIGVRCDVSDDASVEALRDEALQAFGAAHVLCNNAGVGGATVAPIWAQPPDEWDWVLGVNLQGVISGIRHFVPLFLEQEAGGHVVNTASIAGLMEGAGIYGVSKQAVVGLSEGLYRDLGMTGKPVGVSVLCPGWVATRIMESERNRPEAPRPQEIPEEVQQMRNLMKGMVASGLDPQEVGRLVVDAIRNDRFYILTHPTWNNMIENRFRNIVDGKNPSPIPPAGMDPGRMQELIDADG